MTTNDVWGGRRWPELTQAERRAFLARQIEDPRISPYFRRVLLAMVEHGCGWSQAFRVVDSESSRIRSAA